MMMTPLFLSLRHVLVQPSPAESHASHFLLLTCNSDLPDFGSVSLPA